MGQAPGFFGKVPSHGDFVSRRLPPEVRKCFDDWLQACLLRSRQELGADWLPTWLNSPIWRFLVGAGVCNGQAWAGVMMPSHDRVGRCFPLLLAAGIDGTPSLRDCLTVHDGWFARLEEVALSALEEGFALQSLDADLAAMNNGPFDLLPIDLTISRGEAPAPEKMPLTTVTLFEDRLCASTDSLSEGSSAWWSGGPALDAPYLAVCGDLPPPPAYAAMLDGGWEKRGWYQS